MSEKTLDTLEPGDVLVDGSNKYVIVSVQGEFYIVSASPTALSRSSVYVVEKKFAKENNFTFLKPLGRAEKIAKELLESVGFRVTR